MNTAPSLAEAKRLSNVSVIDPFNHLQNGRQFSKEMDIIINVEDQSFQADAGRTPTDDEIGRPQDNIMRVDWIRVYKPVSVNGPQNIPVNTDRDRSLEFTNRNLFAPSGAIDPEFTAGEEVSLSLNYATGSENGEEEAINYVAVLIREIDEDGEEVASSPFTAVVDIDRTPDLANQGIANFAYTIPTTFDEEGNLPIPSSDELEDGHQLLMILFMSVDNYTAFADTSTTITYINNGSTNATPAAPAPVAPAPSPNPVATNSNPQVSFTNLGNGSNFSVGENLGVTVNATDIDGNISNVRLSFDGTFIRQENITPYNWGADNPGSNDNLLNNLTAGNHTLTAVAIDNDGNITTETITISVTNPTATAPTNPTPAPAPNPGASIASVTNVALNKTATQSGTLFGLTASFANDGDTENFSHTDEDANAWIEIDLGERYNISQVNIWNREDCCEDRLSEYQLFISDQPFSSTDIVTTANQTGVGVFFQNDVAERPTSVGMNFIGRYVRIQLIGTDILHPAEIEVFGTSVTTSAKILTTDNLSNSVEKLNFYPNPVSKGNHITVENTLEGNTIKGIDFAGRLLINTTMQQNHTTIDVSALSSGLYFISLNNQIKKLIVN
ncbi:galactose-binding domain-containing protein [Aquimarina agarivorans]|uniref:galactose-binding domain-containing protein n=1 Tax=Aquimarina agarivorans TaxID=980584 RepID=UPI000306A429|nr:discoidin domain-containing protein [Aquimarina agarivorans]